MPSWKKLCGMSLELYLTQQEKVIFRLVAEKLAKKSPKVKMQLLNASTKFLNLVQCTLGNTNTSNSYFFLEFASFNNFSTLKS